ncbi:hypothetical protein RM61_07250 [Xanthomonas phaseoli pv. phaseoli]|uniref:hypothetical protein n=1 Tax=Xanthomonas phaseoli TaxID=1985254 RepID=UPI000574AA50|nr:hypothetical protein [Xanthomonas phaseoli]KHS08013.1 hypothetical protein RM61_07250 [Xanthomonas phaseoli pv. phaseoli]
MSIIEEVRGALGGGKAVTSAEAIALHTKMHGELAKAIEKRDRIAIAGPRARNNGPAYQQMLLSGTNEQIAAMQRDFDELCIEVDRARALCDSLQQLKAVLLLKEADEGLPGLQQELVGAVAAAEECQRAFEAALDHVEGLYQQISQARGQLNTASIAATAEQSAEVKTIRRLVALAPFSQRQRVSMYRGAAHGDNIGQVEDRQDGELEGIAARGWHA